jgi:alkylation response protein AidB-like acyl-CoA dehydrogenase
MAAPALTTTSILSEADAALILEHAAASERAGMLTPALQELIHARGWLRMLAPQAAGGAELALPQAVRLEEAIAAVDGSTGWTVTLCAGAGWFAGFLPHDFAREVIGTPRVCLGGSGAPTGYADIDGDGYRVTGSWDFATGAPMTTHFTLNAVIRQDGQALTDERGAPRIRAFVVPAGDVAFHENWHATGLRATASHSFSLDGVSVDARHAFDITPQGATAPGPLFRFPFLSLAFVTLAANLSGMGSHFVQLAGEVIAQRKHHVTGQPLPELPQVRAALAEAQTSLQAARSRFYELLDEAWDLACREQPVIEAHTRELHAASLHLVDVARRAVDELFPFCGLRAVDERAEIGRVWRDLHTASQHALMLPVPA